MVFVSFFVGGGNEFISGELPHVAMYCNSSIIADFKDKYTDFSHSN